MDRGKLVNVHLVDNEGDEFIIFPTSEEVGSELGLEIVYKRKIESS